MSFRHIITIMIALSSSSSSAAAAVPVYVVLDNELVYFGVKLCQLIVSEVVLEVVCGGRECSEDVGLQVLPW